MPQQNQPGKRKTSSSKKGKQLQKASQPVTFKEKAFINLTDPPPAEPATEMDIISEKLFHHILEAVIKQFAVFLETYGGYYSRAALMEMFDISSKTTLNNWMKEKGLPFYQVDTKIVIKKSDLEEFLKSYRKIMKVVMVSLLALCDMGDVLMMAA